MFKKKIAFLKWQQIRYTLHICSQINICYNFINYLQCNTDKQGERKHFLFLKPVVSRLRYKGIRQSTVVFLCTAYLIKTCFRI